LRKALILLLVILLFSSCSNEKKQLNVIIIGKADDFYWNDVKIGAEAAGDALGVNVKFFAPSKQDPAW
jgi:ABC-type sugar transport system substrate-binding protein